MKIKTKLIISFCIIIFVPSILAIATISAYCNFQSHVIEQTMELRMRMPIVLSILYRC